MFDLFSGLDLWVGISLVLALGFVLAFEFINGFHDTANAVATVIYTKAMSPYRAVILSGIFNFLGVLLGGVGVAYAIVHLLPVELLINVNSGHGLAMVFSLLAAAIAWNLGTWYFGIPASSSHTLIGSILGVGLANAVITGVPLADGVNWQKAIDIAMSLIFSPLAGFFVAALVLIGLKWMYPLSKMHKTPETRREVDEKKHPPFWNRLVLVLSAMTVSFVHGSNDGQKGIGLIMLVLIGIVPAKFVLDLNSTTYQIERTRDAAIHLSQFYQRHTDVLGDMLALGKGTDGEMPELYRCEPKQTESTLKGLLSDIKGISSYNELSADSRVQVRRYLLCLDDTAKKVGKLDSLPAREKADLEKLRKDLTSTTEYAPFWVIIAVALALGVGTMVGWKRVVLTVGEKIGKQGMTYAQGISAQLTATAAIGMANLYSLPVSTTHVLSSGVAGTMVANRSGLQGGTVRNILMAWILTLPTSMALAAGLFWLASRFY
ncbi:low-affinity inorganic phosphate transporter [Pseudomonas citronellolis]|uniref:inorganic phosphate transporter n=1 Tax=Pseudomonas citronellolis TaxID=53408 RepID=UPI00209DC5E4|nr:inorganic phosphate transporter [Pseudomonas citronellolis]MCP1642566.1 low-affinity inorganic phosphate transporter [Pseudomonas citronellolis]MCP1665323.1 low-affinity inorganic phosphate transporter [Pseudomonas citronellolis]MCP1696399.1 low-affinity inorganic phosphate transporter [Pseudomonas citronellolis]MCP1702860.1 low-affinity inorganic phosphate transporter [Pseudomonas citronellolis]MCP1797179.1 low-affinity inorganic phosphate transporter [Pseudomonas citronellolis]